jgi:mannose-6-phosphate isomerase-like protein (cupin superfamily)
MVGLCLDLGDPPQAAGLHQRPLAALTLLLFLALAACTANTPRPTAPPPPSATANVPLPTASRSAPVASTEGTHAQSFDVASVGIETAVTAHFSGLLDIDSMKVGVYRLPVAASDPQGSHRLDETYVVLKGSAVLHTSESDTSVTEGSIVFVRGGVSHRFEQIVAPLTVVVLFAKAPGELDEPPVFAADATSLAEDPSPTANLWRRFIKLPSLTGGVYLLPFQRGGDRSQTHQVDELNVVISGTGVLHAGSDDFLCGPGTLIFVPAHVHHAFHDLGAAGVVLIFWPANP